MLFSYLSLELAIFPIIADGSANHNGVYEYVQVPIRLDNHSIMIVTVLNQSDGQPRLNSRFRGACRCAERSRGIRSLYWDCSESTHSCKLQRNLRKPDLDAALNEIQQIFACLMLSVPNSSPDSAKNSRRDL